MSPKIDTSLKVWLGCAVIAAAIAALPARADYPSTVLSQGPLGYWRLNETTQPQYHTNAANSGSLGASASGTYVSSPVRSTAGPFAGSDAVGFDGSSQYVTTPWVAGLNTPQFTVELWVNPAYVPFTNAAVAYVAASAHLASPRSGWYLAQDDGSTFGEGSAYTFRMFYQNGSTPAISLSTPVLTGWTHLVITFDGTTASIYTNGTVANSGIPLGYVPNVDAPFNVGIRSDGGYPWPGQAAEAAIYSGALSANRVAAHYHAATTAPATYASTVQGDAPLLYDRFQEPPDVIVTAADIGSGGSALDGTYSVGTTPGTPGPRPNLYPGFESTNDAVTVNGLGGSVAIPALNLDTNTVTIAGWVKAVGSQNIAAGIVVSDTPDTYAGLTIDGASDGLGGGYALGYVWNDNDPNTFNWSPTVDGSTGGAGPYLPQLNDSEWAFVALVIRPTQAEIYLASPTIPFSSVTNVYPHSNEKFDSTTLFGADLGQPATNTTMSFSGGIDEVAIWNRSLAGGELYTQFGAAVGGLAPIIFADLQPTNFSVGDTLILSVDVGGTPNLSYQWFNSTGPILSATNSVYEKVNAQIADTDTYHLVVTNLYGKATSASSLVTVQPTTQPVIVTPPTGTTLYPGGTLNLSVVATGGGLKYQWNKGGTPIPGATGSAYVIPSVVATNAGSYGVVVTNYSGFATSSPVTVTIITPAANSYEAAIVADAPEAWYRLDETNGATYLHDSMGRHDGAYTNSTGGALPKLGVPGALAGDSDTAVSFDGSSSGIGWVPFSTALNSEQFAVEAWVNTTVSADNLMAVSSHSATFKGYGLWEYPAGEWAGEVSQGGQDYIVPSTTAAANVVAGQWTHIVEVYGTSSGLQVFINGQWDGSSYVDFSRNTDSPFVIGAFGPVPVTDLFNGQVDEVAVYGHALTLAQAQNHYSRGRFTSPIPPFFLLVPQSNQIVSNSAATTTLSGQADGPLPITYQWYLNNVAISGATNNLLTFNDSYTNAGAYVLSAINGNGATNSPAATIAILPPAPAYVNVTNGLVLHLKFDDNYQDSSGRGNNGTPTGSNAMPSFVAGRLGSGAVHYETDTSTGVPFNLNHSAVVTDNSYVTLGNATDLQFSSNVDFSVSYWVMLPTNYLNGDLPFFCSSVGSTYGTGFTFAPAYTNGGFGFSYNGVGLQGPANSINDGNWHHLLHSVSRTGYAYAYLDGVQVNAQLASGIGNMNTAGPVNIGQDPTGLYPEQGSATVDDLAVWRRALSEYEAYSVYYAATNANASFDVPPKAAVQLHLSVSGTNILLTWKPGSTLGTLEQATDLTGPWTPVGAYVPAYQVPPTANRQFYRLSFIQ